MATVQRYVNTASSGGDGTTNATSGANAAYASLASWEANAGGSASDAYIVDCCGVASDTTGVTVDFPTNIDATGSVTIRGNRSDPAGFYSGNQVISTSHYRLSVGSSTTCLTSVERNFTVDGIQVEHGDTGSFRGAIVAATDPGDFAVRNSRIRNTGGTDYGIGAGAGVVLGGNGAVRTFENNLIVGFDVAGISAQCSAHITNTWNILHNTVYGDGSSTGILLKSNTGSGAPVFNVKGNAIANSGTGPDISASQVLAGTVNYADNATDQYNLGTTDEIDLGAPTDAWTLPGTSQASDFTVKDTASALYAGVSPTLLTTDITGYTRDGASHDVGAFELQSGAGPSEITLTGANGTQAHEASTGAVTQAHALAAANAEQANTASSAPITQAHALTAANAAQSADASTGSITQAHTLAGANAEQAHLSSTGAISTEATIVLVGAGATQAHAASPGAIAQTHALAGEGAQQAHAGSTGAITQAHALAADSATQAHASSTGAIVVDVVVNLAGANASQAASATTGAITQTHVLVAAPSVQDHIAAESAIVQEHVLAGANATQAHAASSGAITQSADSEIWSTILPNGKTAGQTLAELHAYARDIYRIHGLELGVNLIVTPTRRTAGDIDQAVASSGDQTTVSRH